MAEQKEKKEHRFCPYCDEEIMKGDLPFCQVCGLEIFYCPRCRKPVNRDNRVCPHCGAEIKGEHK
jgi:predicted amidophosphoribosyltransferase